MTKEKQKNRKAFSDPLGLDSMTFKEARGGRQYDPSGLNTFQDIYDRPLPKELLDLCISTKCSLCELDFTSPIVAKSHFLGKTHSKRTNLFLQAWSARTKNPLPKRRSDYRRRRAVSRRILLQDLQHGVVVQHRRRDTLSGKEARPSREEPCQNQSESRSS